MSTWKIVSQNGIYVKAKDGENNMFRGTLEEFEAMKAKTSPVVISPTIAMEKVAEALASDKISVSIRSMFKSNRKDAE